MHHLWSRTFLELHTRCQKELQSDTAIVIKPADEGSCIVILDMVHYLYLSDMIFYEEKDLDPTYTFHIEIWGIIKDLYQNRSIDYKVNAYLSETSMKNFQILPPT